MKAKYLFISFALGVGLISAVLWITGRQSALAAAVPAPGQRAKTSSALAAGVYTDRAFTQRASSPVLALTGEYYDDFSDPGSGWPEDEGIMYSDRYWSRGYLTSTDEYYIKIDQGGPLAWFYQPDALAPYRPESDEYCVETSVRFEQSGYWANAGLVFGANEANTDIYALCLASLSGELRWSLGRNGSYEFPRNGCASISSVAGGSEGTTWGDWNQLRVCVDGDDVEAHVGDVYVGTWTMAGLGDTTRVGLIGGDYELTPIDIRFDYFRVTASGEWHVCPAGPPTCDFASVQDAVDAAGDGEVIKVAAGTYTGVGVRPRADCIATSGVVTQMAYISKTVTIRGGYSTTNWVTSDPDANLTTLDAQGQGRVFYVTGDASPVIEGFRITGGDASGMGGEGTGDRDTGGGVYVVTATATIMNNWIFGNTARSGGGIYVSGACHPPDESGAMIAGNAIFSNTTAVDGGGGGILLAGSNALVQHNTIRDNYGNGVVVLLGSPHLDGNVIRANTAYEDGGGVFLRGSDVVTLTNNIIVDNYVADTTWGQGSGLYLLGSSARLLNNTIANNTGGDGGGIHLHDWVSGSSSVMMTNTLMADQSVGVNMMEGSTVTVNSILWHNTPVTISLDVTATVSSQNEVAGDPAFVNPDAGDYHIGLDSMAIDQGVTANVGIDIDGQSRPIGAGYDLGADEYPYDPVSGVQISRLPLGDLFTGKAVHFTVDANGTTPFTYTWMLDGAPVGQNRDTFEHTFNVSSTYMVGVTVTNRFSQGSDAMIVVVTDPPPQWPDLSQSSKSVSLASVDAGDTLTYTIVLRNTGDVTATATLTDPIPNHTTYVSDSLQASSSTTLTIQDGQIQWSGKAITGTPVVIQFAVEVTTTGLSVGGGIINVAYLDDGMGNVMMLEAESIYNPGYGLSIDDGALYTNIPTVTLRYSWNVAEDIVNVKFSNDGGFGPGSSDWLPVNVVDPTYSDWVLYTYGDLRIPRTVYVKFRYSSGVQYGPFQDDIVYDPVEPQITEVEIITQTTGASLGTTMGQNVIVRVKSSDDNSGASKVQISHGEGFSWYSEFAVAGVTTDIPWTLQSSGKVYVRVVDRAGNLSEVVSEQGPLSHEVYLPLVLRGD